MADICVAYLVHAISGIEPVKTFLNSYAAKRAGVEHDLLIIFKGFEDESNLEQFRQLLTGYPHIPFHVPDAGYDITSYFRVAQTFHYPYFCFLNSYSIILDEDWLSKMHHHITRKAVGLVGATGSYESMYTSWQNEYAAALKAMPFRRRVRPYVQSRRHLGLLRIHFPPFPNYHVRTNAFMIPGTVMSRIRLKKISTKMDAWKFESGRQSLTRQVMQMNCRPIIVGRNGEGYEKEDWFKSGTFRQGGQENLLVADNQTNDYRRGDPELRRKLSRFSWADKADPAIENAKGLN